MEKKTWKMLFFSREKEESIEKKEEILGSFFCKIFDWIR